MKRLIIVGAGGFGKEVLEIAQSMQPRYYEAFSFIDDGIAAGTVIQGIEVLGGRNILAQMVLTDYEICIAVGDPVVRKRLVEEIEPIGLSFATIVDPKALVRPSARIGKGVILCANVAVSTNSSIGDHVVVNIGAIVGHDVVIEDYSVVNPGAVILGNASLHEGVTVGAAAILYPQIEVGSWSKIAMGSGLYKSIEANVTVAGNPARVVAQNKTTGAA